VAAGGGLRTRVYIPRISYLRPMVALVMSAAVLLSGCWTVPSASVRPAGEPRVIAAGIEVDRVVDFAQVESVDRANRTVALSLGGVPLPAYKIGRSVRNWSDIRTTEHVRATIEEVLTVYVAGAIDGNTGNPAVRSRSPDARVLVVDPSYRLLTVQYPTGGTDTFKVALNTQMRGIEAGDAVAIRQAEVTALRVQRHWLEGLFRSRRTVTSAR